jgi:hypothetical protein
MDQKRIACFAMLLVACLSTRNTAVGQCRVNDTSFNSQDGGCKDLKSGLVWSPDHRALGNPYEPNASAHAFCNTTLNGNSYGGYSDWRPPTVGETQTALANGLYTHLDYFLNGNAGDSAAYYWTACAKYLHPKKRKFYQGVYAIRHSDGAQRLSTKAENWLVCVRGKPRATDCETPLGSVSRVSPRMQRIIAGGTLLLPLCMVAVVTCMKRRRL